MDLEFGDYGAKASFAPPKANPNDDQSAMITEILNDKSKTNQFISFYGLDPDVFYSTYSDTFVLPSKPKITLPYMVAFLSKKIIRIIKMPRVYKRNADGSNRTEELSPNDDDNCVTIKSAVYLETYPSAEWYHMIIRSDDKFSKFLHEKSPVPLYDCGYYHVILCIKLAVKWDCSSNDAHTQFSQFMALGANYASQRESLNKGNDAVIADFDPVLIKELVQKSLERVNLLKYQKELNKKGARTRVNLKHGDGLEVTPLQKMVDAIPTIAGHDVARLVFGSLSQKNQLFMMCTVFSLYHETWSSVKHCLGAINSDGNTIHIMSLTDINSSAEIVYSIAHSLLNAMPISARLNTISLLYQSAINDLVPVFYWCVLEIVAYVDNIMESPGQKLIATSIVSNKSKAHKNIKSFLGDGLCVVCTGIGNLMRSGVHRILLGRQIASTYNGVAVSGYCATKDFYYRSALLLYANRYYTANKKDILISYGLESTEITSLDVYDKKILQTAMIETALSVCTLPGLFDDIIVSWSKYDNDEQTNLRNKILYYSYRICVLSGVIELSKGFNYMNLVDLDGDGNIDSLPHRTMILEASSGKLKSIVDSSYTQAKGTNLYWYLENGEGGAYADDSVTEENIQNARRNRIAYRQKLLQLKNK